MAADPKYADSTAQHAADATSGGLPQMDFSTWSSQIFWLLIIFAALYLILWQFILPRIGAGLTERSDRIADDLDAAARMQKEAEQASITYDRVMANAKAKAHNIAETTRKSVDESIAQEMAEAEAELTAKQEVADQRIAEIRASALAQIDMVAEDVTTSIVTKIGHIKPTSRQVKSVMAQLKGK